MICKIFINTQPVVVIKDEYYDVDVFLENEKLKKDIAYIIGDMLYVYHGKWKSEYKNGTVTPKPGIYKSDDSYIFIEPDDVEKHLYNISNINELSMESIFDVVERNKGMFIQPEDIEIINNNTEIYVPTIKDNDDFLKYLVKKMIIDKKINLRNYKERFTNEYALNNMKSGLNKTTKMTVTNFRNWCQILGVDCEIRVSDNGTDIINPLPDDISISLKDF